MATTPAYPTLQQGSSGNNVKALQCLLNYRISAGLLDDGSFGAVSTTAVKNFQSANGLVVDGVAGPITLASLVVDVRSVANSNAAKAAQWLLSKFATVVVDGNFGSVSDGITKTFQGKMGLLQDGLIGAVSWQYLFGYNSYPAAVSSGDTYVSTPAWPSLSQASCQNSTDSNVIANVKALQCLLNYRSNAGLLEDGGFGAISTTAVKNYQSANGLVSDGVAGALTLTKLIVDVKSVTNNSAAKAAQCLLKKFDASILVDGNFGAVSDTATKAFQKYMGLFQDGLVGSITWQHLFGYSYYPASGSASTFVSKSQLMSVGWPSSVLTDAMLGDLNSCLSRYQITTKNRICHFISQCSHESGCGQWVKEIASGSAYEGRTDLGNIYSGDGPKFKGGGYLQLTGRTNYTNFSNAIGDSNIVSIGVNYLAANYPWTSAGYFWYTHGLNAKADSGATVEAITKIINGGTNGLAERQTYYNKCLGIF
jgi:putative chitinase